MREYVFLFQRDSAKSTLSSLLIQQTLNLEGFSLISHRLTELSQGSKNKIIGIPLYILEDVSQWHARDNLLKKIRIEKCVYYTPLYNQGLHNALCLQGK